MVLGVRRGTLAEQERDLKRWKWALRSKSKKANPKPWSLCLRTVSEPVKSSQGWEAGTGQEYLSSFLSLGRSSAFSPLGELTFRNVPPFRPTSALHLAVLSVSSCSLCLSVSASSNTFGHWEIIAPIYLFPP